MTKLDTSAFTSERGQLKAEFDRVFEDQDRCSSKIKTIEAFIDRYQPVRILLMMRECLKTFLSRKQIISYNLYERQKLKMIHDQLLKEEQNSDISAIIKSNLMEINTIIQDYKDASTKL